MHAVQITKWHKPPLSFGLQIHSIQLNHIRLFQFRHLQDAFLFRMAINSDTYVHVYAARNYVKKINIFKTVKKKINHFVLQKRRVSKNIFNVI